VDEYTTFFLVSLCLQEYASSWWQQRQLDVRIGRTSKVEYWSDLKACMRRNFFPPSYDRKRKLREEMKNLVRMRRKFVGEEKEYARREKEFKEKNASSCQKEKREREENERKDKEEKEKREKVMIEKESTKTIFLKLNQISITFYLL